MRKGGGGGGRELVLSVAEIQKDVRMGFTLLLRNGVWLCTQGAKTARVCTLALLLRALKIDS